MNNNTTLQINLSAGDLGYVQHIVPGLVNAHGGDVAERLAIVDCCRPQATRTVEPDEKFPEIEFRARVEQIVEEAEALKANGYLDRIYYLYEDDPLIPKLHDTYARGLVNGTHDFRSSGWASYFAIFEVVNTPYVVHYDGDMLIHQCENYDWLAEGRAKMKKHPNCIAVSPRISPPFADTLPQSDAPSLVDSPAHIEEFDDHWRVYFFSTRCFLTDLRRIKSLSPFVQGTYLAEFLARKATGRSFPPSPEIMIHRTLTQPRKAYRIDLKSPHAYLLHPDQKDDLFFDLAPDLVDHVRRNHLPPEQLGRENILNKVWKSFLD